MPRRARPELRKAPGAYHHGDLERALTDASIALLAEHGPGFTLRQVAQRVGVAHSAAYRHFADREALLAAISRRGFVTLHNGMKRAAAKATCPEDELRALLAAYVRFARRHPAQYDLMFGPRLNESGRFDELEVAIDDVLALLHRAVARHLDTDDRLAIRDRGLALWSLAHGYMASVLRRRIPVRSTRAAERHLCALAEPFLA